MKNKKVVSIISTVLFLIIVIGASFAYLGSFTEELENNVAVNIYASNTGNTSFIATSADMNIQVPLKAMFEGSTGVAASDNATITVKLSGQSNMSITCTYDVVFEYDLSSDVYGQTVPVTSGVSKEITMQVSGAYGTNNYSTEKNFSYDSTWTAKTDTVGAKKTLIKGATIKSYGGSQVDATNTINISGKYYNADVNQDGLANKHFTGKIYVENNKCSASKQICGIYSSYGYNMCRSSTNQLYYITSCESSSCPNATCKYSKIDGSSTSGTILKSFLSSSNNCSSSGSCGGYTDPIYDYRCYNGTRIMVQNCQSRRCSNPQCQTSAGTVPRNRITTSGC